MKNITAIFDKIEPMMDRKTSLESSPLLMVTMYWIQACV